MRRTLATAGRTVLFSSLTVAAAIASLMVFPQRFLYSMGIGGSLVALIAAAIALIVLPAVLALLGARVNSLSPRLPAAPRRRDARAGTSGFWYRLSRFVMRRPGPIAAASAGLLIALGHPLPRHQVHLGGRERPAAVGQRAPGRRAPRGGLPAPPRRADPARVDGASAGPPGALSRTT